MKSEFKENYSISTKCLGLKLCLSHNSFYKYKATFPPYFCHNLRIFSPSLRLLWSFWQGRVTMYLVWCGGCGGGVVVVWFSGWCGGMVLWLTRLVILDLNKSTQIQNWLKHHLFAKNSVASQGEYQVAESFVENILWHPLQGTERNNLNIFAQLWPN